MTVTIVPEQNPAGEAHLEPFLTELVNESLDSYAYSNAVFLCERLHAASPTEVRVRSLAPIRPVHQRAPDRSDTTQSERSIGRVRDAWVRLPERSRLVVPKTTRSRLPPTTTHRPPDPPTALRSIFQHQANKHLLATCYYRHDQANRAYHTLKGCTSHRCRYLLALCCVKLRKLPEAEAALSHSALPAGGRPPATDSSAAERPASDPSADITQRRSRPLPPRGHMQRDRARESRDRALRRCPRVRSVHVERVRRAMRVGRGDRSGSR